MLSFALIVVGLVLATLTVLGAFAVVQIWNDVDTRARKLMDQYQREAQAEIEGYSRLIPCLFPVK
jgi:hypothetical protein